MPLAGAEVPKLLQVRTASPLLCRPPVLLARPWPARTLFLSSLCHLLPSCHAGVWLTPPVHRGANARIHQSGYLDATLFLPRAFSAEMEMQLTRSQVDYADDIDDFWSERASEPCCWMDQEAGASDASFFQVASCARRGNIYLPDGVCPSTQDATNEFPSETRHTGVQWYQYPKPYGDGQLRSVPQPAPPLSPPSPPSRKRQTRHSGSRSAPLVFIPTPSPPPTAACRLDTCKDGSSTCEGRFRAAISLRRTAQWKLPILAGGEVIESIARDGYQSQSKQ